MSGQYQHRGIVAALISDRGRLIALASFMLLVGVAGGSSRSDMLPLVVLRPAAVLFTVYALLLIPTVRGVKGPLLVVLALMLVALLQLMPLPSAIWRSLPQRSAVDEASMLLGMDNMARALSLDPNRTWNTFFSLFVPLAAICLAAVQVPKYRRFLIPMLIVVGVLSGLLGFFQAVGGNGLHLYRITHSGYPVGLFANKNHQSMMLLWVMLATSWVATTAEQRRVSENTAFGGALAMILVLFPLLVLTGSRAGLLLSLPTLSLCCWFLIRSPAARAIVRRPTVRAKLAVGGIVAVIFVPLLSVFAVLALSDRQTALSRLFELETVEDVRWQYLPLFRQMIQDFMPLGSGFGSFENAFNMYEPSSMLTARYMNQAHNDLLQLLIEGGLPALAILLAALAWLARAGWRLWRSPHRDGRADAAFLVGSVMLWLLASLVDYPLRTPLAAMLVAALTAHLGFRSSELRSSGQVGQAKEGVEPGVQQ